MNEYVLVGIVLIIIFVVWLLIANSKESFGDFAGLEFNTRFPNLNKIRYNYKDYPARYSKPIIYDYAFLRDLPFELTNIYYARINPGMIITKYGPLNYYLGYYPDVTNLKYKCQKPYYLPPITYNENNPLIKPNDILNQNYFYGYDYNKNFGNAGSGTPD